MTREEKLKRWEEIGRLAKKAMEDEARAAVRKALKKAKVPNAGEGPANE